MSLKTGAKTLSTIQSLKQSRNFTVNDQMSSYPISKTEEINNDKYQFNILRMKS